MYTILKKISLAFKIFYKDSKENEHKFGKNVSEFEYNGFGYEKMSLIFKKNVCDFKINISEFENLSNFIKIVYDFSVNVFSKRNNVLPCKAATHTNWGVNIDQRLT